MESWRTVLRDGFMPSFSIESLKALEEALSTDSPKLTQGASTTPPPLMCVQDWPCEAGCFVSYAGWQGGNNPDMKTVGEVEQFFAKACYEADQRLGEPAACRWFLNAFDDTPRGEIFSELLQEVRQELIRRESAITLADKQEARETGVLTPCPF